MGQPSAAQAGRLLRQLFALSFTLHIVFAFLVGGIMMAFSLSRSTPVLFAQIMVAFSLLQLPLTLWLSRLMCKVRTRQAYISATLLSGTLLATPAWFLTMAFLVVTGYLYHLVLLTILILYYLLGLVLCGRWGNHIPRIPLTPNQKQP